MEEQEGTFFHSGRVPTEKKGKMMICVKPDLINRLPSDIILAICGVCFLARKCSVQGRMGQAIMDEGIKGSNPSSADYNHPIIIYIDGERERKRDRGGRERERKGEKREGGFVELRQMWG